MPRPSPRSSIVGVWKSKKQTRLRENDGLEDLIEYREVLSKGLYRGFECFISQEVISYSDIHIGELYENYPIFDSYDLGDDRTYQNYIFRKYEITNRIWKPLLLFIIKETFA